MVDDGDSAIGTVSSGLTGVFSQANGVFSQLNSSTASMRDELILQRSEHGRQYQGYMEASMCPALVGVSTLTSVTEYVLPMDEVIERATP